VASGKRPIDDEILLAARLAPLAAERLGDVLEGRT
jgi:hypothetical protein